MNEIFCVYFGGNKRDDNNKDRRSETVKKTGADPCEQTHVPEYDHNLPKNKFVKNFRTKRHKPG